MINMDGLSLVDKARAIAHEIIIDSTTPLIKAFAKKLKTPYNAEQYLLNNFKYNVAEVEYELFEPSDILRSKIYDCKADTLFIGSIAKALGYKVELRIVSNGTNHIYPLVYHRNLHKWVALDPVPKPPSYILKRYHTVVQGEVTNNLNDPIIGVVGFSHNPIGIPDTSWKIAINHPDFTRQQLISDIAKSTRLSSLSGFSSESVEIPNNYVPQPGDILKFYYNTIKELPLSIDEWIRKEIISRKNDQFDIIRVYNVNKTPQGSTWQDIERFFSSPIVNKNNYIVVEVKIKKPQSLGAFALAIIAISAVLIAGIGYLTLVRVEKVIDSHPALATSLSILPYIGLGVVALAFMKRLHINGN